jgi:DNA-binding NarL/FixJ family response regulator
MQTLMGEQSKLAPVRVLLADDSELVRRAVHHLLNEAPWVHVVGEAESFAQTFELCTTLKPKIVVLDLHMRDESKFTAAHIKTELLSCAEHILAISVWNDDVAKELASSYGAFTLLDKITLGTALIPAILKLS